MGDTEEVSRAAPGSPGWPRRLQRCQAALSPGLPENLAGKSQDKITQPYGLTFKGSLGNESVQWLMKIMDVPSSTNGIRPQTESANREQLH